MIDIAIPDLIIDSIASIQATKRNKYDGTSM